jgi:hypothetical protein
VLGQRIRRALLSPAGMASVIGLVAVLIAGIVLLGGGGKSKKPPPRLFQAVGYRQSSVYHSPQSPGLTEFVGAWTMADGSLMTAFTQATGPLSGRTSAPLNLQTFLAKNGYPPDPHNHALIDPKRDFWGLQLSAIFMRSTDGGATWKRWRVDPYRSVYPHPYSGQSVIGLSDGSLLRDVNGFDLLNDTSVPHTGFLQRLSPGAKSWSAPQVLLDPTRYVYQISRIRRLSDGRLIALGADSQYPAPTNAQIAASTYDPKHLLAARKELLLMVSSDEGRTWKPALTVPSKERIPPDEWDAAELPNGNLVAVLRTPDPKVPGGNLRYQALLEKQGDGWVMSNVRRAPLPPGGHPELLAARGGPVLYASAQGLWYTDDAGSTWRKLPGSHPSDYYPRSVQAADGTVYVLSHRGGDFWYGEGDESIVLQKLRLLHIVKPKVTR